MRSKVRRAVLEYAGGWPTETAASSSSPVLKTALDEGNTNKGNSWTSNDGWEELLQKSWSHERETDLEQCAERSCSQNGTVSFLNLESALRKDAKLRSCYRAGKLRSSRAHSVLVHSEVVLFLCGIKCTRRLTVLTPWSQLE
jgi:hypothetical protein